MYFFWNCKTTQQTDLPLLIIIIVHDKLDKYNPQLKYFLSIQEWSPNLHT